MRVLQVNSHGQPLHFIDLMRACGLLWEGKATLLIDDPERTLRSPSWETPFPLVIMLTQYYSPIRRNNRPSRMMIFARDGWQCQYCSISVTRQNASLDHLIPRDWYRKKGEPQANAHKWENLVTACHRCNGKKGNRLPEECGMYPKNTPRPPDPLRTPWAAPLPYHPLQREYVAQIYKLDPQTMLPL